MYSLETERLILRPFEKDDVAFLDYLHSDLDVVRYTSGHTRSHAQNMAYIDIMLELHEENLGHLLVLRKADKCPIGRCGFSYFTGFNDGEMDWFYWGDAEDITREGERFKLLELGYSFAKKYWGKGYATEAAFAVSQFGFNKLDLCEISSLVIKKNLASVGVAQKLGKPDIEECMVHDQPAFNLRNYKNG